MKVRITDRFTARPLDDFTLLFLDGEPIVREDGSWVKYRSIPDAALVALTWPFKSMFDMTDGQLRNSLRLTIAFEAMGIYA